MPNRLRHLIKNQISRKAIAQFYFPALILAIICFSILVRLVQYLYNRSLWADEAVLALNIVNRSYLELLQPLDYEQGAPLGFLLVEKLAVQLFGNNEYALRLFPFLSSLVSLFLFYRLARRCIAIKAIPIALALFASLNYLVYYATEVKQYSSDVAIAILSCLLGLHLKSDKLDLKHTLTLSLGGAIAIWFSHPAIFVLAGVVVVSLLNCIGSRETKKTRSILLICLTWFMSFVSFYFICLRNLSNSEGLLRSWLKQGAFPQSSFDIIWLLDSLGRFFSNPLGFPELVDGLAIAAFLIGCISYRRKKLTLLLLLSPVFVTFGAAYLYKYPFSKRLVLFLTPFMILLIAEGAEYIRRKTWNKPTAILGVLFVAILLVQPVVNASSLIVKPYTKEEIKPVMSYVKTHQQPGDILYVYQRGIYQFKYYAEKYGYREGDYIIGVDDLDQYDGKDVSPQEWSRYKNDLDRLRGNRRVWLIFAHAHLPEENQLIKSYLERIGRQADYFERPGVFVYLYDLS